MVITNPDFCKKNQEKVCYDESLLEIEVEEGLTLCDILWGGKNGISPDGTAFLREMINKKCRVKGNEQQQVIMCSCGSFEGVVGTLPDYAKKRQDFLRGMKNHKEYGGFMTTCFPNSVFSNECEKELAYIKGFEEHVDEITASGNEENLCTRSEA